MIKKKQISKKSNLKRYNRLNYFTVGYPLDGLPLRELILTEKEWEYLYRLVDKEHSKQVRATGKLPSSCKLGPQTDIVHYLLDALDGVRSGDKEEAK